MSLIKKDSRPLYMLVKEKIDEKIENGEYKPGDRLPSEAKLSENFGVSRATLREALRVLEKEGKVNRQQGIGTFITEKLALFKSGIEELNSITQTIEAMGLKAGTVDLKLKMNQQVEDLIKEFELNKNDKMVILHRTRTADDKPVAYCEDYLPQSLLPNSLSESDINISLLSFLQEESNIYISYAVADILPVITDEFLAKRLDLNIGDPVLLLKQMHYDDRDNPVLYSKNYFRSDKFEFHVLRNRG
ncbi:GntR family transcriptional regulator [Orenia metallireducens]|uniref:Transcriptional regulator, GntR family n=1 Tax=Orenia metallireducens TaxID=1413210 RepID=A0A285FLL3_9FIRM|nr:GntR family transcriptional regulator [Orenia metallireducens]PRX33576.1 GntR family transcriptional regulator [Orenia metallireducens]SNY11226.1 transcriptional regulator, GntR family [Orenia metallireducens]